MFIREGSRKTNLKLIGFLQASYVLHVNVSSTMISMRTTCIHV